MQALAHHGVFAKKYMDLCKELQMHCVAYYPAWHGIKQASRGKTTRDGLEFDETFQWSNISQQYALSEEVAIHLYANTLINASSTRTTSPVSTSLATTETTTSATASSSTTSQHDFLPVDGGDDRACRGAHAGDYSADYYMVRAAVPSLESCKNHCMALVGCVGIEYSAGRERCEVWTRAAGIQASSYVSGFLCLRYFMVDHHPTVVKSSSYKASRLRLRAHRARDLTVGTFWMQRNTLNTKAEL